MIERLPRFAEHHFASLCASAGVVCNASTEDECGWDFFLQFPAERRPPRPADMQPSGPEALVQVKSRQSSPTVARMKLSNALRAAQASQPFFLILLLPGAERPRIYARHFWEAEIATTLRRVRLAEREGDSRFNKRHLDLRMTEDDRQDDLLGWMRATIKAVKPAYAAEKARLLSMIGHEDGYGLMDVTFEGSVDDLLNLQLGLIDSLPLRRARYVPQRFGIEAAHPLFDADGGSMFVDPGGKPARLRLQGGRPTSEMLVDATFYGAAVPGEESVEHRWRVDAGPLRLIGGSGSYSAKLSLEYAEARPLSDLATFLTLAAWRAEGPVGLQLFLNEERVPLGILSIETGDPDGRWRELHAWARALQQVQQAARTAEPSLSMVDLGEAGPLLQRFAGFIASPSFMMTYHPEGAGDPARGSIYYVGCDVGAWCFLAVVERSTTCDQQVGERRSLTFGKPQLLDAIVRQGRWRDARDEIEAAYQAQVERMGHPDWLWEMGELEAFISEHIRPSR